MSRCKQYPYTVIGMGLAWDKPLDPIRQHHENMVPICCLAIPLQLLRQTRLRFRTDIELGEDWTLWMEALQFLRVVVFPEVTAAVNLWNDTVTNAMRRPELAPIWRLLRDSRHMEALDVPLLLDGQVRQRLSEVGLQLEKMERMSRVVAKQEARLASIYASSISRGSAYSGGRVGGCRAAASAWRKSSPSPELCRWHQAIGVAPKGRTGKWVQRSGAATWLLTNDSVVACAAEVGRLVLIGDCFGAAYRLHLSMREPHRTITHRRDRLDGMSYQEDAGALSAEAFNPLHTLGLKRGIANESTSSTIGASGRTAVATENPPGHHAGRIRPQRCIDEVLDLGELEYRRELRLHLGPAVTEQCPIEKDVLSSRGLGMKARAEFQKRCNPAPRPRTRPRVGLNTPAITRRSVLFPAPLRPTMPNTSRGLTTRLTPRKAQKSSWLTREHSRRARIAYSLKVFIRSRDT